MKKITDLERFAMDHIVKPYQDSGGLGGHDEYIKKLPLSLEDLAIKLAENSEWSNMVLNRISRIGFTFPDYINHELVNVIKSFKRE